MKINVSDLMKKKILDMPFKVYYDEKQIQRDDFKIILVSPLEVSGVAYYNNHIVTIEGKISALIKAQCSRCLEYLNYPIDVAFDEEFSKSQHDDVYSFDDTEIELDDMVIDNLILSMPVKFLCKEECKGLCPICGINLNNHSCDCKKEDVDPRLLKLKDLFKAD